ncbi:hypothetical protein [Clostridium botulinum]|uniref:Uncharacterized protein n=1 Tax=Clostridium botulinum CFSAN001627 TaxID=1232189 RepID=M1ZYX9_CLOBO|nr:hypothetical protein [Clostridium botulinum]EKN42979.1 hypothetical protein CFSAN001627_03640 [Clostridium botulinum CFSAN001627]MBY6850355.1 hypothetical protein [Clostridium botulinum]MBY6857415.1 hypothetical protein [Clostridium botulinum]MBY6967385.1 hypothetical protein [Clostridium botulinum]HBJ1682554.1 hypothetical protein [Clostridium botulinum]
MDKYKIIIRYNGGNYSEFTTNEESKMQFINILEDKNKNLIELIKNRNGIDLYIYKNNICCVEVIDNENNMYK